MEDRDPGGPVLPASLGQGAPKQEFSSWSSSRDAPRWGEVPSPKIQSAEAQSPQSQIREGQSREWPGPFPNAPVREVPPRLRMEAVTPPLHNEFRSIPVQCQTPSGPPVSSHSSFGSHTTQKAEAHEVLRRNSASGPSTASARGMGLEVPVSRNSSGVLSESRTRSGSTHHPVPLSALQGGGHYVTRAPSRGSGTAVGGSLVVPHGSTGPFTGNVMPAGHPAHVQGNVQRVDSVHGNRQLQRTPLRAPVGTPQAPVGTPQAPLGTPQAPLYSSAAGKGGPPHVVYQPSGGTYPTVQAHSVMSGRQVMTAMSSSNPPSFCPPLLPRP